MVALTKERLTGKIQFIHTISYLAYVLSNRMDCFEATFVHLTERFSGKEVYLVGTLNQSSMLAQRTQKLIQEVQPDAVMVQTNAEWWDTAKMLQYVDCQDQFT